MRRPLRGRPVVGLVVLVGSAVLTPMAAHAGEPVGTLSFSPATGSDSTPLTAVSTGTCTDAHGAYLQLRVSGAGFPDDTNVTPALPASLYPVDPTTSGYDVPLQNTLQAFAAQQQPPAVLSGTYTFRMVCRGKVNGPEFGVYTGSLTFTSRSTYRADAAAPLPTTMPTTTTATTKTPPTVRPTGARVPKPPTTAPPTTVTPTSAATGTATTAVRTPGTLTVTGHRDAPTPGNGTRRTTRSATAPSSAARTSPAASPPVGQRAASAAAAKGGAASSTVDAGAATSAAATARASSAAPVRGAAALTPTPRTPADTGATRTALLTLAALAVLVALALVTRHRRRGGTS